MAKRAEKAETKVPDFDESQWTDRLIEEIEDYEPSLDRDEAAAQMMRELWTGDFCDQLTLEQAKKVVRYNTRFDEMTQSIARVEQVWKKHEQKKGQSNGLEQSKPATPQTPVQKVQRAVRSTGGKRQRQARVQSPVQRTVGPKNKRRRTGQKADHPPKSR